MRREEGAYLPIMSDEALIVKGTGSVFLAGSHLVNAAIGENINNEELGGANTHCDISGVTDYKCEDDKDAINLIRDLISLLKKNDNAGISRIKSVSPKSNIEDIYGHFPKKRNEPYEIKKIIEGLVDDSFFENINQLMEKQLYVDMQG